MNCCYFCLLTLIYTITQKKVNKKMHYFERKRNKNIKKMYLCLNMKITKYILILGICLAHAIMIDAQAIYTIDAIVETDSHLWTLTTIEKDSLNLVVNWEVISKKSNTEITLKK